jgi:hypothetical protein
VINTPWITTPILIAGMFRIRSCAVRFDSGVLVDVVRVSTRKKFVGENQEKPRNNPPDEFYAP